VIEQPGFPIGGLQYPHILDRRYVNAPYQNRLCNLSTNPSQEISNVQRDASHGVCERRFLDTETAKSATMRVKLVSPPTTEIIVASPDALHSSFIVL
jgi:hypothetical protein